MNAHTRNTNLTAPRLSRRSFIVGSAAAGSGLALGFNVPFNGLPAAAQANRGVEVNAWVVIKSDDTVSSASLGRKWVRVRLRASHNSWPRSWSVTGKK